MKLNWNPIAGKILVEIPSSKPESKRSAVLRTPWRYFFGMLIVCFILGLAGVVAGAGSGRRIHPEWSTATFVSFGVGISVAYAAVLSFVGVGCGLMIACSKSDRVKWLLRSAGLVPLALSGVMLLCLRYGGKDPLARLMSLLPFMQGIVIVFLLGVILLSCHGWRQFAKVKRGERFAADNLP